VHDSTHHLFRFYVFLKDVSEFNDSGAGSILPLS